MCLTLDATLKSFLNHHFLECLEKKPPGLFSSFSVSPGSAHHTVCHAFAPGEPPKHLTKQCDPGLLARRFSKQLELSPVRGRSTRYASICLSDTHTHCTHSDSATDSHYFIKKKHIMFSPPEFQNCVMLGLSAEVQGRPYKPLTWRRTSSRLIPRRKTFTPFWKVLYFSCVFIFSRGLNILR